MIAILHNLQQSSGYKYNKRDLQRELRTEPPPLDLKHRDNEDE